METRNTCTCDGIATQAIQSLDFLNDQISHFCKTYTRPSVQPVSQEVPDGGDPVHMSIALMQKLIQEAQNRFRTMVDDNKRLATRIDGSLLQANHEVHGLRVELADTNKRLEEITIKAMETKTSPDGPNNYNNDEQEICRLKQENSKLEQKVRSLNRDVEELRCVKAKKLETSDVKLELAQSRHELSRLKEVLYNMKTDRKKLKGEKLELLNQMKQLYNTVEDKEKELRDFIRNYEQRINENDENVKQLTADKEDSEREKWEIMKRARDATERSLQLKTQLDLKDKYIDSLKAEIVELKECVSKGAPYAAKQIPSDETQNAQHSHQTTTRNIEQLSFSGAEASTPKTSNQSVSGLFITQPPIVSPSANASFRREKKKSSGMGSISKVFSRSKNRSSAHSDSKLINKDSSPASSVLERTSISVLSTENCQEKLELVDQCKTLSMCNWKAGHVLAWIEVTLSMAMYGRVCAENIKSGKVLLGLSDSDLESALGIANHMHRMKLRLAIEELRLPNRCSAAAGHLDHSWVSTHWLNQLGLIQYQQVFEDQMIDGRMLNELTRKDMDKYLNIHRKFHQCSIHHATELLRLVGFDKELLSRRRSHCETVDCDPVVWTNQRVILWIKYIDLHEYSDNLIDSGVNGAVMVLEPSFNADAMATALGIPPSKSYIRRHLAQEMDQLIRPARVALEGNLQKKSNKTGSSGSLGRSFDRSFKSSADDKKRSSLRGSLGRAFGRKIKAEMEPSTEHNMNQQATVEDHLKKDVTPSTSYTTKAIPNDTLRPIPKYLLEGTTV